MGFSYMTYPKSHIVAQVLLCLFNKHHYLHINTDDVTKV